MTTYTDAAHTRHFKIAERMEGNARAVRADVECDTPDYWNEAYIDQIIRDAEDLKRVIQGYTAA